ncbi:MAG: hypothetical protein ABIN94_16210, partial [Ferruginibacter sp.]
VGGIPELIDEHNGILVESGDTAALAAAMMRLIDNYPLFDRKEIAAKATAKFNYDVVGQQYSAIYDNILNNQSLP